MTDGGKMRLNLPFDLTEICISKEKKCTFKALEIFCQKKVSLFPLTLK